MNGVEAQAAGTVYIEGRASILIFHTDQMTQMMLNFQASFWFNWHIGERKNREFGDLLCHRAVQRFCLGFGTIE